ncbi:YkgJ family cysteine cluster protein [Methanocella sp. MCL-LM]|uniref:YkgJ family cysteine cluster protein n=1 Tax=Methanocella sp. MCL-LM TaxID=3412035 RepID=UPI003C745F45
MASPQTIEFVCKQCGDCCRKHALYPVTSSDLVMLAQGLGITIDEALREYCVITTHDGRRGMFLRGLAGECPFLKDDRCIVHSFKPAVCSIFPDPDGFITTDRLKACLRDTAISGKGLSRCGVWDLPDGGILAPNLEETIRFRIREDTDRQYFMSHEEIDADKVEFLARLAEYRQGDLPLYLSIGKKYGALRQFHTGGQSDMTALVSAERDILYRYLVTYIESCTMAEKVLKSNGVRATFVAGEPGIMVLCEGFPETADDAQFLWAKYGETGIFAVSIESDQTAYLAAFTIETPCLGDIVRDHRLPVMLNDGHRKLIVKCSEGIL